MLAYTMRRLLVAIPTMLVIITVAFFMMRFAPGSPFDSERALSPEIREQLNRFYGFDKPIFQQFVDYLVGLGHLQLGPSLIYKDQSVSEIIASGFPVSLSIGLCALVLATCVGVPMGLFAALKQNSAPDYSIMALAMVGICVPSLVVGPILSLVFGVYLGWLPTAGLNLGKMTFETLLLPVVTLSLAQIAIISRLVRSSTVEILRSNFVRTARAKGLSEFQVLSKHALRAALLPLVSYLGPACAALITGSVVVETVFQLPGIGKNFVTSALQRDYPVVMAVVILYAGLIIFLNLMADLAYGLLDPKVKYE
ncbi:ABC transporter permease [Candidatus Phycosocius spiralis]|uniref:ABC transporter n=1 Tax=Candidatus Phycosocius spiralis TaxID=2815099 RepID=A0ABQ4PV33_9PROT|nr:ABC transporter permease subunit [Candidatus Phycosocius spiralis]GIU66881.1 ABC transporter [Candidatus Phycosocius spiralis]